jgi:transcription antitermination factor NusG
VDVDKFLDVRGVADFLRDDRGDPVTLPHEAVLAIFAKQWQEHQLFMQAKGGRKSQFKPGDLVKIEEGSAYSGLVANIEKIDGKGRVAILLGMIRHWMPADMVVAA